MKITRLFFFLLVVLLFFGSSYAGYPNLSDYPSFLSPEIYVVVIKKVQHLMSLLQQK
ncbi:MAG: hypothetical protein QMD36_02820 [Candidatus Aenigmarchaeota archaeon]|nr:hypothetical protein [Candidatus Aenigmarchaeota archaeon]